MAPRNHRRTKPQPRTLVAIVRDCSTSMSNRVQATITGTKEYVSTLRSKAEGEMLVSLIDFNHEVQPRFKMKRLNDIDSYQLTNYRVSGTTALLDAVGSTIELVEAEERSDDRISFVIMTDGLENTSRFYDQHQIRDMIREREEDGWEFIYLGAGRYAWAGGDLLGVRYDQSIYYDDTAKSHGGAMAAAASATATTSQNLRGSNSSYMFLARSDAKQNLESTAGSRVAPTQGATSFAHSQSTPSTPSTQPRSRGRGGNAPDSLRKRAIQQKRDQHGRFIPSSTKR